MSYANVVWLHTWVSIFLGKRVKKILTESVIKLKICKLFFGEKKRKKKTYLFILINIKIGKKIIRNQLDSVHNWMSSSILLYINQQFTINKTINKSINQKGWSNTRQMKYFQRRVPKDCIFLLSRSYQARACWVSF